MEKAERNRVLDGPLAPKLTGRNRQLKGQLGTSGIPGGKGGVGGGMRGKSGVDGRDRDGLDPSALAAVRFCLSLFSAVLRRDRLESTDPVVRSMASPFIPLLGQCLRLSEVTEVVTLAVRCLTGLLSWDLPCKVRLYLHLLPLT